MAQMHFEGTAVTVRDMPAARFFYENVLGQTVLFDVGESYVHFASGVSLWQENSAAQTLYGDTKKQLPGASNSLESFELYFECEELEQAWEKIRAAHTPIIHEIVAQAWGQRCFRVRDPDGNVVEVGEPMSVVAARYLDQGLSVAETAQRTLLPEAMVQAMRDEKL